jgi:xanthine dehydrogenase YagS FAD-binding subunit
MHLFQYSMPKDTAEAIRLAAQLKTQPGSVVRFIAGGTTLLDLMKLNVEQPSCLVDINRLGLDKVEKTVDGGIRIGAMVRNADLAHHPLVQENYKALSEALLSGASAQLRNMATTGGNLLQRTRCVYFRNIAMACNKRLPGSGCSAITGENRTMAVLGISQHCIATNPSDMGVALTALEATIHIRGVLGDLAVPIHEFHLLPGDTPHRETVMEPGNLITYVTLPPPRHNTKSCYLKLRDRASYEFALSSSAVIVEIERDRFRYIRVALGGVGTKPWRSFEAEQALLGQPATEAVILRAAKIAMKDAHPQSENGFKIELAQRCIAHALRLVTGMVRYEKQR